VFSWGSDSSVIDHHSGAFFPNWVKQPNRVREGFGSARAVPVIAIDCVIECQTDDLYTWCARVGERYFEMVCPKKTTHAHIIKLVKEQMQ